MTGSADGVSAFVVNNRTRLGSNASPSVVERPDDETKLRVFAEELSLAKETLVIEAFIRELRMMYERTYGLLEPNYPASERRRISTPTDEREAVVDEDLARERVEIETVPMNLRIDAVPVVRQEGDTTSIPVVEE